MVDEMGSSLDLIPPEEEAFPQGELDRTQRRRWILQHAPKGGICAEFGVFRGHFAEVIADELKPKVFHLVDEWTKSGELFNWGSDPYTNFNKLTTRQAMYDACRRMKRFEGISQIVFSEMRCEAFCEEYEASGKPKLDFIYIDTTHTYADTLAQLRKGATILQERGVIAGDDWTIDPTHSRYGLMRAVHEFMAEANFELVAAGPDAQFCLRRAFPFDPSAF